MKAAVLLDVYALSARHEGGHGNIESSRDLDDVRQGHVSLASFDLADVGKVEAGSTAQFLLTPFQFLPSESDLVAESNVGWAERSHSPRSLYPGAPPV